jgi:hypothetical protein
MLVSKGNNTVKATVIGKVAYKVLVKICLITVIIQY